MWFFKNECFFQLKSSFFVAELRLLWNLLPWNENLLSFVLEKIFENINCAIIIQLANSKLNLTKGITD